jgi:hypothetical protein
LPRDQLAGLCGGRCAGVWRSGQARGQLVESRAAELRFTPDEAAVYLNETMGLQLTARDVAALEGRTEGWIAALQLAALSIHGRDDVAGFIARFAGDDRCVVDYLAEEVLQRQADGDLAGALDLLNEAERLYMGDMLPNARPVPALKARVWIAQGRLGEALGWVREPRPNQARPGPETAHYTKNAGRSARLTREQRSADYL